MTTIWTTPQLDISIQRGDTFVLPLEISSETAGVETATNLTGCTLYLTIKRSKDDVDPGLLQKTVTSHDTPLSGLSHFTLSATETRALPSEAVLYFDVQLKDATAQIFTQFEGNLMTSKDITITTA